LGTHRVKKLFPLWRALSLSLMNDDWNPCFDSGIILKPHLQKWEPGEKAIFPEKLEDELYDPDADLDDERWVDEHLTHGSGATPLLCKGCFTPVCYESQKHEKFDQYRAVTANQCKVDKTTTISENGDEYYQVTCDVCTAEVGVFEIKEEIYHFFNVMTTASNMTGDPAADKDDEGEQE